MGVKSGRRKVAGSRPSVPKPVARAIKSARAVVVTQRSPHRFFTSGMLSDVTRGSDVLSFQPMAMPRLLYAAIFAEAVFVLRDAMVHSGLLYMDTNRARWHADQHGRLGAFGSDECHPMVRALSQSDLSACTAADNSAIPGELFRRVTFKPPAQTTHIVVYQDSRSPSFPLHSASLLGPMGLDVVFDQYAELGVPIRNANGDPTIYSGGILLWEGCLSHCLSLKLASADPLAGGYSNIFIEEYIPGEALHRKGLHACSDRLALFAAVSACCANVLSDPECVREGILAPDKASPGANRAAMWLEEVSEATAIDMAIRAMNCTLEGRPFSYRLERERPLDRLLMLPGVHVCEHNHGFSAGYWHRAPKAVKALADAKGMEINGDAYMRWKVVPLT